MQCYLTRNVKTPSRDIMARRIINYRKKSGIVTISRDLASNVNCPIVKMLDKTTENKQSISLFWKASLQLQDIQCVFFHYIAADVYISFRSRRCSWIDLGPAKNGKWEISRWRRSIIRKRSEIIRDIVHTCVRRHSVNNFDSTLEIRERRRG